MKISLFLAGLGVAFAFAGTVRAAPVTIEQSLALENPSGGLVYNIATDGGPSATTSYYELIVDSSWTLPTRFTTFSTEPVGGNASYAIYTDTNAGAQAGNTGALLTSWTQTDIPANNSMPFFSYLLTAGQYVLQISTTAGQFNVSTKIAAVPLPGAMWLFATGLVAFLGISSRRKI